LQRSSRGLPHRIKLAASLDRDAEDWEDGMDKSGSLVPKGPTSARRSRAGRLRCAAL